MTETQTEPSKELENQPLEPQPPQKPWRRISKPVGFLAAIGILSGVGFGVYRLFFYQPEPDGLFLSPPLTLLAGVFSPLATMPSFMQWLSYLDPLRYFVEICRGVLLKGVGFETLWPQVLVLLSFAVVLMSLSIRQFRRQLS